MNGKRSAYAFRFFSACPFRYTDCIHTKGEKPIETGNHSIDGDWDVALAEHTRRGIGNERLCGGQTGYRGASGNQRGGDAVSGGGAHRGRLPPAGSVRRRSGSQRRRGVGQSGLLAERAVRRREGTAIGCGRQGRVFRGGAGAVSSGADPTDGWILSLPGLFGGDARR